MTFSMTFGLYLKEWLHQLSFIKTSSLFASYWI